MSEEFTVVTVTVVNSEGQSECGSRVVGGGQGHTDFEEALAEARDEATERANDNLDNGYPTRMFTSVTKMPAPKHSGPTITATLGDEPQSTVSATIS